MSKHHFRRYAHCTNIHINGVGANLDIYPRPIDFEHAIANCLGAIRGHQAGKALLTEIGNHGSKVMTIVPWHATGSSHKPNAFAKPSNAKDAEVDKHGHHGKGSSTMVHFSPEVFKEVAQNHGVGPPAAPPAASAPEDVLLHEMVHGVRQMAGLIHRGKIKEHAHYDNEEEFFAILVANIFVSEKGGGKGIRKDHKDFSGLGEYFHVKCPNPKCGKIVDLKGAYGGKTIPCPFCKQSFTVPNQAGAYSEDTSQGFLIKDNAWFYKDDLIEKLQRQQPHLYRRLGEVDCHFNPIRAYNKAFSQ